MKSKEDVLKRVGKLLSTDRNKSHGDARRQLSLAAIIKSLLHAEPGYAGRRSFMEQEAIDQIVTKLSRLVCGAGASEHWEDIVGYGALGYRGATDGEPTPKRRRRRRKRRVKVIVRKVRRKRHKTKRARKVTTPTAVEKKITRRKRSKRRAK